VSYILTFTPWAKIPEVGPSTLRAETADAAWELVLSLEASDEEVISIRDPAARLITREDLHERAKKQAD
jgi:hypothetical protein